MEVKNKIFSALSHIERAPKIFICLFIILLMNCGSVFASGASEGFEYFLENDSRFTSFKQTDYYTTAMNVLYNYENIVIYVYKQDTTDFLNVYVTNNKFYEQNGNYYVDGPYRRLQIWLTSDTKVWRYQNTGSNSDGGFGKPEILYTNSGILKSDGSFAVPPTNIEQYYTPYFEFINNKIGTIQINNINYSTYNILDFKSETIGGVNYWNLGKIYIDKDYSIQSIFSDKIILTLYNLSMNYYTTYTYEYDYTFTQDNNYNIYTIMLKTDRITWSPYIYIFDIYSIDKTLSDNLKVEFVSTDNTIIGPVVGESGEIISGDSLKDNTTLGDVMNEITEPYNPNESILNELNSGDILDNMGYQSVQDPYQELWDTIIKGLKNTLTKNEDVIFEFEIRENTHIINSKDIYMPDNSLKTFIGYFINFILLMQMFTFIKKRITELAEGALEVMDNIGADIYFF